MPTKTKKVKFLGQDCNIKLGQYSNKRIAIQLLCENGSPMAVATVNLHNEELGEGNVFIKDWSENEGMFKALFKAKIIGGILRKVKTGFVEAFECALLIPEGGENE